MSNGIYIATAGAVAQSNALDVTANNIANATTTAYRGERVSFGEALANAKSPDLQLVGHGTEAVDTSAGALMQTGNPLDVALDGDGYIGVDTAKGVRYTRNGSLQLDATGKLVTSEGLGVRNQGGGSISIPEGTASIRIDGEGGVWADDAQVGTLELAKFGPKAMTRDGSSLMAAHGAALADDAPPRVVSGVLEQSNVNVVRGVVDLVKVSRTYESLMRIIEGYSQIEGRAARDIGGPK